MSQFPIDWPARAAQIAQWRTSGLSLRQWALQNNLSRATLVYWIKHLSPSRQGGVASFPRGSCPAHTPLKLAAIQIAPSPISDNASTALPNILLRSPGGWQITLPVSTDMERVRGLLKSLP